MSESLLTSKQPSHGKRAVLSSQLTPTTSVVPVIRVHDIRFPGADLARPRYESLIRYGRLPQEVSIQPELAFQILPKYSASLLEFHLSIEDQREDIRFDVREDEPAQVRVENLKNSSHIPGLVEAVVLPGTGDRQCRLIWDQSLAGNEPSQAMRIFCAKNGRLDPLERVEGGIYLTILAPVTLTTPPTRGEFSQIPPNVIPVEIKADSVNQGRVEYDIFHYDGIPQDIEVEPSFRVQRGQNLALNLMISMDCYRFQRDRRPDNNDQVVVETFPETPRPRELSRTEAEDQFKICRLFWHRSLQDGLANDEGEVYSFGLGVVSDAQSKKRLPPGWPETLVFDPTVVQPPACTPQGVCS